MGSEHQHVVTFNGGRYARLNKVSGDWDLFGKKQRVSRFGKDNKGRREAE